MKTSEKTGELVKSLFAFQRDLTPPRTDSTADTGKFTYDYLSLPGLIAHCKPLLTEWSLVVVQEEVEQAVGVGVTTRVIHAPSAEWIEFGPLALPASGTAQNYGSAYTYGRRYGYMAALGIATADDDAASASSPPLSRDVPSTSGRDGAERGEGGSAYGEGADPPNPQPAVDPREPHPGKDHILKPSRQPNVPDGVTYCIIAGCDFVFWPAGTKEAVSA